MLLYAIIRRNGFVSLKELERARPYPVAAGV